jgi:hypothetical protein
MIVIIILKFNNIKRRQNKMNEIQKQILKAATYAMSATAIAKLIGKSKANQIINDLEQLVSEGKLTQDTTGKFPMYKVNNVKKTALTNSSNNKAATASNNTTTKTTAVVADTVNVAKETIPEGYTISKIGKRKSDGLVGRKVTLPNGKSYFVEIGDTIVNINDGDEVRTITSKNGAMPEAQLSTLIENYTKTNGMTAYTIKSKCGSIGRGEVVGVLDYKITKCNKAA